MVFLISVAATFLAAETLAWSSALYLGIIVFFGWSAVDAINNVCDVDLDVLSDPSRAEFTKKLGKLGLFAIAIFAAHQGIAKKDIRRFCRVQAPAYLLW